MAKGFYSDMPPINLERGSVASLLNSADYERMYSLVEALPKWTVKSIQTVTECLTQWLVDALARVDNDVELRELCRLIERLQIKKKSKMTPEVEVAKHYNVWNCMITMINIRLSALSAKSDQSISDRPIMVRLRNSIAHLASPKRVSELRVELSLSNHRMFEVLAVAEEAGLIRRKIDSDEQWIEPTEKWQTNS